MSRWFRFYAEVAHDPKVQLLEPELFKAWVTILCLACQRNGPLPGLREIAFTLRVTEMQADTMLQALRVTGLLDDDGENMVPHNWDKRQYVDRTNAERQRKHRQKQSLKKNKPVTRYDAVTPRYVTHTDTDTDTDTEKNNLTVVARKRASPIPDGFPFQTDMDWARLECPSIDAAHEAQQIRDHALRDGVTHKDWSAAWRTWCRNSVKWAKPRQPTTTFPSNASRVASFRKHLSG